MASWISRAKTYTKKKYSQADKKLGGYLPGGKTPSQVKAEKAPTITATKQLQEYTPPPKTPSKPTISGSKGTEEVKFTPAVTKSELQTYGKAGSSGTAVITRKSGAQEYKKGGKIIATKTAGGVFTIAEVGVARITGGGGKKILFEQRTPTSSFTVATQSIQTFKKYIGSDAKFTTPQAQPRWKPLKPSDRERKDQEMAQRGVIQGYDIIRESDVADYKWGSNDFKFPSFTDTKRKEAWAKGEIGKAFVYEGVERYDKGMKALRQLDIATEGKIGFSEEDYAKSQSVSDELKFVSGTVGTGVIYYFTGGALKTGVGLAKNLAFKVGTKLSKTKTFRKFGAERLIKWGGATEIIAGGALTIPHISESIKERRVFPILDVTAIGAGYAGGTKKAITKALTKTDIVPQPIVYRPDISRGVERSFPMKYVKDLPAGVQLMKFQSVKFVPKTTAGKVLQIERRIPFAQGGERRSIPRFEKTFDLSQKYGFKEKPTRRIEDKYWTEWSGGKRTIERDEGIWNIPKGIWDIKPLRYGQPFVGKPRGSARWFSDRGQRKFLGEGYKGSMPAILSRYRVRKGEVKMTPAGWSKLKPQETYMDFVKVERGAKTDFIKIVKDKEAPKMPQPEFTGFFPHFQKMKSKSDKKWKEIDKYNIFPFSAGTLSSYSRTKMIQRPKGIQRPKLLTVSKTRTKMKQAQDKLLMPIDSVKDLRIPKTRSGMRTAFGMKFKQPTISKLKTQVTTKLDRPVRTPDIKIPPVRIPKPPWEPPLIPPWRPPYIPTVGGGYGGSANIFGKKGKEVGGRFTRSFTANVLGYRAPKKRKYKKKYTGLELRI